MFETITNALSIKIDDLFPSINIYEGEVRQGLNEPCFIIHIPGSNRQKGINRSKQNITINLIYIEDKNNLYKQSAYYNVIDTLYKELELIQADGEIFRVKNLVHNVVDEALHFIFDVSYSYVIQQASDNLMNELDVKSEVKEDV